jgi:hypothetical protein
MPDNILRFEPNIPQQISLSNALGKPIEGKYGPQVFYTLTDGRVMFVQPDTAKQISLLGVEPGESFFICKRKNGQRNIWDLWLTPESEKARARAEEPEIERQLRESISQAQQRRHPQPIRKEAASERFQPVNGTGTYGPAPQPIPVAKPSKIEYEEAMGSFLVIAGRAAKRAESVLGKEQAAVRFNSRDIAAFATTCFIAAEQRGLLTWTPEGPK